MCDDLNTNLTMPYRCLVYKSVLGEIIKKVEKLHSHEFYQKIS